MKDRQKEGEGFFCVFMSYISMPIDSESSKLEFRKMIFCFRLPKLPLPPPRFPFLPLHIVMESDTVTQDEVGHGGEVGQRVMGSKEVMLKTIELIQQV